jgi:hypothetical protein
MGEAGIHPTKWALPAQGACAAAQSLFVDMLLPLERLGVPPSPLVLAVSLYFQWFAGFNFLQIRLSKGVRAKFVFRNGLWGVFEFWEWKKATLAAWPFFYPLYPVYRLGWNYYVTRMCWIGAGF